MRVIIIYGEKSITELNKIKMFSIRAWWFCFNNLPEAKIFRAVFWEQNKHCVPRHCCTCVKSGVLSCNVVMLRKAAQRMCGNKSAHRLMQNSMLQSQRVHAAKIFSLTKSFFLLFFIN